MEEIQGGTQTRGDLIFGIQVPFVSALGHGINLCFFLLSLSFLRDAEARERAGAAWTLADWSSDPRRMMIRK